MVLSRCSNIPLANGLISLTPPLTSSVIVSRSRVEMSAHESHTRKEFNQFLSSSVKEELRIFPQIPYSWIRHHWRPEATRNVLPVLRLFHAACEQSSNSESSDAAAQPATYYNWNVSQKSEPRGKLTCLQTNQSRVTLEHDSRMQTVITYTVTSLLSCQDCAVSRVRVVWHVLSFDPWSSRISISTVMCTVKTQSCIVH